MSAPKYRCNVPENWIEGEGFESPYSEKNGPIQFKTAETSNPVWILLNLAHLQDSTIARELDFETICKLAQHCEEKVPGEEMKMDFHCDDCGRDFLEGDLGADENGDSLCPYCESDLLTPLRE